MDAGVKFRLVDTPGATIAYADLSSAFFFIVAGGVSAGGALIGATPGVLATFGEKTHFTVGVDAPLNFAAVGGVSGLGGIGDAGFTATIRPNVSVEIPIGTDNKTLYLQAEIFSSLLKIKPR